MEMKSSFLAEFLAESNLILTQDDVGNKLYNVLSPIRNFLHKEKDILSFSICRYCEGGARLAFFCEWYYQTLKLTVDGSPLLEEDREYFKKKVPLKLKGLSNLKEMIDYDIKSLFLPHQISLMHTKALNMTRDLGQKHPYLAKYLSPNFINQIMAGEIASKNFLYQERWTVSDFLDSASIRLSFAYISLPVLLGLLYNFNQEDSSINASGVKWTTLESVLKNIAALHQTGTSREFMFFVHQCSLSENEQFHWIQKSNASKIKDVLNSQETKNAVKTQREKLFKDVKKTLDMLVFPEKFKDMLIDLAGWSYSLHP